MGQERVAGVFVSPNFFSVLHPPVARAGIRRVGSHARWCAQLPLLASRFQPVANAIGTAMSFPVAFTIVGVMAPEFRLDEEADLLAGLRLEHVRRVGPDRRAFQAVVRLQGSVTAEALREHLQGIQGATFSVTELREALVGDMRPRLMLLFAAIVAVVSSCQGYATLAFGVRGPRDCPGLRRRLCNGVARHGRVAARDRHPDDDRRRAT